MLTRIKGPKDFLAGAIFLAAGATFFLWSRDYQIGTANRMGPGYFPMLLGIALCLFGLGSIIKGLLTRTSDPLPNHKFLPLVFMVAAVVSFGLLLQRAGFVVASFVCLALVCYQRLFTKPLEVLFLFVGLMLFSYIVFIYFFEMTMPFFWWK